MKAKNRSRFDIGALRDLAGNKVFVRGEAYYHNGQVEILSLEPGRVLAQVAGTEDYRTVLTGSGKNVVGECSCAAFEQWGFCKHMVATALAANAAGASGDAEGVGTLARIRDHLRSKSVDALVDVIVEQAERDLVLFRKLDLAVATARSDDKTLEVRLRKAIDSAIRTSGYIDYLEASNWAADVDAALDIVADLIAAERANLALRLVEHAIASIERAIEDIDDSDGHGGALLDRAQEIHLAACRAARPDPVELAHYLFDREMEGDYDTFWNAAGPYADVLSEDGLREYRRLAVEAWEKLPPRAGGGRAQYEVTGGYARLRDMVDFFAERDGNLEARIALRTKDLSSTWNYLELAEFCLSQGQKDEALRRAEEGLWLFEDEQPDVRLVFFAVDLLVKAGRKTDAEAHLWRAFKQAPSLELYARLRKLGGKTARESAVKALEARIVTETCTRWYYPADLLIRILMTEKMFDAAWVAVRKHGASAGVKESLARASEATHPDAALEVYGERVEALVKAGGNSCYADAFGLVARMAAMRGAAEQTAYVAGLKERFRRKRNFMKLLG